jgi:hypothetical protein
VTAFKLPLAASYNSRVGATNTADSTGYVGSGYVGVMLVGKSTQATDKDARFINCFKQTVKDADGRARVYTVKRAGFGTQSTPAAGKKGYAILVWTGSGSGTSVISAFDNPSVIYNGASSLGTMTGRCTGITETAIGGVATLTVTSTDNTAWYYDVGVGILTQITDGDFPGATKTLAGTFAHLDGFACVATTDGGVYASDINSVTAWTANSFDSSNAYPDGGVALIRHKNFLMNFGTESVQFYYNAGLTPFPFAKATALTLKVGAVSADAICEISDTKFWAGSTPQGGLSIFQYDGQVNRVSTPEVDVILILAGASNLSLTALRISGRSFVLVRAGATTLAYCVEEKFWHEWNSPTPLWYKCAGVSLGGTMVNYAVSNVDMSGKVFLQNHAALTFLDNGNAFTARIQTGVEDQGTNRKKFYEYLDVVGDVEASTSTLTVYATDDDYQNYVTLGTVDLSSQNRRITRLGSAKRRGWVFVHSANTPMRLEKAEGSLSVGNQ